MKEALCLHPVLAQTNVCKNRPSKLTFKTTLINERYGKGA